MLSVCETASGGVGRYQENLLALSAQGITCRVLLPDTDRHILGPGADVLTFRRERRGVRTLIALVRAFLAERKRSRPDLYIFNSTFTLLPLLVLRLLRDRTPSVYCAHCWAVGTQSGDHWTARLIRLIEGNLCGLADLVVNVAQSDADLARRLGYRGRQIVVENAVADPDPQARSDLFDRTEASEVHLLFVGRFDRQKGLDLLLPAFAAARRTAPELRLHLVGGAVRDGTLPDPVEGVTLHGWIRPDRIDDYYRSADALIVPSRWEGMPLVILEALRNGTPVLASSGCGMGEILRHTGSGGEFSLTDGSLGPLLARLRREDLAAMRADARATFARHFTLDRFVADMARHLRELAGGRRDG